jgi:hypothetical protein
VQIADLDALRLGGNARADPANRNAENHGEPSHGRGVRLLPGQVPQRTMQCGVSSHASSQTRQIAVFYAPFPELSSMIYKSHHGARTYLVVDDEAPHAAVNVSRSRAAVSRNGPQCFG